MEVLEALSPTPRSAPPTSVETLQSPLADGFATVGEDLQPLLLPKGIAPPLLAQQVHNTVPYLFDWETPDTKSQRYNKVLQENKKQSGIFTETRDEAGPTLELTAKLDLEKNFFKYFELFFGGPQRFGSEFCASKCGRSHSF